MKLTNAETFEKIVKSRANERVQARIRAFRADVFESAVKNGFINRSKYSRELSSSEMAALLQAKSKDELEKKLDSITKKSPDRKQYKMLRSLSMRCFCSGGKWAGSLWEDEEAKVRGELLETLDEMQRALLAADKPIDSSEGEPDEEEGGH